MAQAPATPPEPTAARAAAQQLVAGLQFHGGIGAWLPPGAPAPVDPVDAFTDEVRASWGGNDAFRERFAVLQRVAPVNGHVEVVAADGSVAHVVFRVNLPRPEGAMHTMSVSLGDSEWWANDPDDVRRAAARQLKPDQQGEYELRFNALVERQADGTYLVATDLLRLVDEHVGGLQRLLEPTT